MNNEEHKHNYFLGYNAVQYIESQPTFSEELISSVFRVEE
jgi:hypothetical protein